MGNRSNFLRHIVITWPSDQPIELPDIPINDGDCIHVVEEQGDLLVFDGHVHIQSNNCCPLPIWWGITTANPVPKVLRSRGKDRKSLSDLTSGYFGGLATGRFGPIGRLPTQVIARSLFGDLDPTPADTPELSETDVWIVMSDKKWQEAVREHGPREALIRAGEKAKIQKMGEATRSSLQREFVEKCRDIIGLRDVFVSSAVLLMDLSYAHYWGGDGIPVYLATAENAVYCNDFISVSEGGIFRKKLKVNSQVIVPNPGRTTHHLFSRFLDNEKKEYGSVRFYRVQAERSQQMKPEAPPLVHFLPTLKTHALAEKQYIHFIDIAPMQDRIRFEDYHTQIARSEAAALEHPLRVFPFYHYDPRRHYDEKQTSPGKIAESILEKHAFFEYRYNAERRVTVKSDRTWRGALEAWADERLNNPNWLARCIGRSAFSNEKALRFLYPHPTGRQSGLFWGVKMYPRLGYRPDDYERYPHLKSFYEECQKHSIPITFHCSPGGMRIADVHNYLRYDREYERVTILKYDFDGTQSVFDGRNPSSSGYHAPRRWRKVLEDFPRLKLCMAHFGGGDLWKEAAGSVRRDTALLKGTEWMFREWQEEIAALCDDYDNVYTDISCYSDPSDIADGLVKIIKDRPVLRDRIIMGSDWYMIEMDKLVGRGEYLYRMLSLLKRVGREAEFDAWTMFTQVNPLRFLGLMNSTLQLKGSRGPYDIETKKLNAYLDRLAEFPGQHNEQWRDVSGYMGMPDVEKRDNMLRRWQRCSPIRL